MIMSDKCCNTNKSLENDQACCNTNVKDVTKAVTSNTNCCSNDHANKIEEKKEVQQTCCNVTKEEYNQSKVDINRTVFSNDKESLDKFEYLIHGMDCPSCALTIEKGLNGLKAVREVKVNYNTAKLHVLVHRNSAFEIENQVKKLGFTIEALTKNKNLQTYNIEGMDCGSCAKSIENHLNTISSVKSVSVNFSTGKMKLDHENSVDEIISEVAKIGFKATLQTKGNTSQTPKKNNEFGSIIVSGVLISLGFIGSYTDISPMMSTFLYAFAMVLSGYKPVKSAFYSIRSRSLDMNVLMSVAAIGAALIGEWLEGATVVWLFALGTTLQNKSIEHTRNSIRNLMDLAPAEAWVRVGETLTKKPVEDISIDEIIIVKPGDKIPLDGEIIVGESSVNQAPITGESIPVDKNIGDSVYAGSINENGSIEIKVTKLVEDTTIAKIIHLVEEAQEQKAPTQAFVDKFASIYTPVVFILALLVMIIPPLFTLGSWGEWFYKGLELLVVACPCALVISTPVAIVSAIGNAARNGVLIKGGTFLETAGSINAIAFDKTGTLTEGKPAVTEIKPYNMTENELLSIALTLEEHSSHPIAKTIVNYVKEKGVSSKKGDLYKSIVGKGVQATVEGNVYYAGNLKLFEDMNIALDHVKKDVESIQNLGRTVVIIGTKHDIKGLISVSDTIRKTTVLALNSLKQIGVKQVVMLTGDNDGTARLISKEANINRYFSELLPEDKVSVIKQLQNEGLKVAMVGDGINDAPALATADLGIAMGGAGTDTAMETADIVLMADNLEKLPHTMKLSRKALTIIKQNIWFSLIIKFIALALIFPGWLTLWLAVLSDTGAAIIVILNALRLLKVKQ